jgi:hypothetical protein
MEVNPEDEKEENFIIHEEKVAFFSTRKLIRLFLAIFLAFFSAFGLLFIIDAWVYPELGMVELARKAQEKTDLWRQAKRSDLGHEAIAFENMLDAYALRGGDISHALDTLTDEFTAANWAELLEYDIDYFLKHEEVSDSIKASGMTHVIKILYTSGHYDLFKQGYKILVSKFSSERDYLRIYNQLIPLESNFDYDDEEERQELAVLYELELRRHLKLTAARIIDSADKYSGNDLKGFAEAVKITLDVKDVTSNKSDRFKNQFASDMTQILTIMKDKGAKDSDNDLLAAGLDLTRALVAQNVPGLTDLEGEFVGLITN